MTTAPHGAHEAATRANPANAARFAVTTLTIVPVPAPESPNRAEAGIAMSLAPVVGLVLGAALGGLAIALRALSCPSLVTGLVIVAVLAGLTRGLHLDGLADTADGLGSYRPADRALAIMKSPEIGPFGVVAIVLALAVPAASVAGLLARPWWAILCGVAAALGCGRTAITWACRHGVPAATTEGLGAFVAGTTGRAAAIGTALLIAAVSAGAAPDRPWQGPVAVAVALAVTVVLVRHATKRLGGITGDVLGACVETATAITLVGLVLG